MQVISVTSCSVIGLKEHNMLLITGELYVMNAKYICCEGVSNQHQRDAPQYKCELPPAGLWCVCVCVSKGESV